MKYEGIIFSDIHVGAFNLQKLHEEYTSILINYIKNMKKLDFVIVAGDFFDHKFYLNDKEATMAYIMLKELMNVCKEKNCVVRFIYGTESHECNQYDIFSLLKLYDNVEVIKTVKDEELLPDLNVLYIPEEYINNKDEYYSEFFNNNKKYDYIFGHGIIREVATDLSVKIENSSSDNSKRKKQPIFKTNELDKICKGQIYFGHYHLNIEVDDKFFSISSFSRWRFGEEGRKGFYKVSCDTEKEKYKQEFIENVLADKFVTISYSYKESDYQSSEEVQNALDKIDKIIEREPYNHMRFIFNIPSNSDNPESTINYIKERFKNKDLIKVDITNGYIEEKKKQNKEKIEEQNSKYLFIFDSNLPLEEKINRFIQITWDKKIDNHKIQKYIYNELKEILESS